MFSDAKYFSFNSNYLSTQAARAINTLENIWILIFIGENYWQNWWKMFFANRCWREENCVSWVPWCCCCCCCCSQWTQLWINLFLILKTKAKTTRPSCNPEKETLERKSKALEVYEIAMLFLCFTNYFIVLIPNEVVIVVPDKDARGDFVSLHY